MTVKVADAVALSPDAPLLVTRGEQSGRHGARRHAAWSHSRLARTREANSRAAVHWCKYIGRAKWG